MNQSPRRASLELRLSIHPDTHKKYRTMKSPKGLLLLHAIPAALGGILDSMIAFPRIMRRGLRVPIVASSSPLVSSLSRNGAARRWRCMAGVIRMALIASSVGGGHVLASVYMRMPRRGIHASSLHAMLMLMLLEAAALFCEGAWLLVQPPHRSVAAVGCVSGRDRGGSYVLRHLQRVNLGCPVPVSSCAERKLCLPHCSPCLSGA